jgi:hypothetical protein
VAVSPGGVGFGDVVVDVVVVVVVVVVVLDVDVVVVELEVVVWDAAPTGLGELGPPTPELVDGAPALVPEPVAVAAGEDAVALDPPGAVGVEAGLTATNGSCSRTDKRALTTLARAVPDWVDGEESVTVGGCAAVLAPADECLMNSSGTATRATTSSATSGHERRSTRSRLSSFTGALLLPRSCPC